MLVVTACSSGPQLGAFDAWLAEAGIRAAEYSHRGLVLEVSTEHGTPPKDPWYSEGWVLDHDTSSRVETWLGDADDMTGMVVLQGDQRADRWAVRNESVAQSQCETALPLVSGLLWYPRVQRAWEADEIQAEMDVIGDRESWRIQMPAAATRSSGNATWDCPIEHPADSASTLWLDVETHWPVRLQADGEDTSWASLGTVTLSWSEFEEVDGIGAIPFHLLVEQDGEQIASTVVEKAKEAWPLDEDLVGPNETHVAMETLAQEIDRARLEAFIDESVHEDYGHTDSSDLIFRPDEVVAALGMYPGMTVADVGAGDGYFTYTLARAAGAEGAVWATEVNHAALTTLVKRGLDRRVNPYMNVRTWLNAFHDVGLADESVDLFFLCNVTFPRFEHLSEDNASMLLSLYRACRPGGKLAIIEKRRDDVGSSMHGEWSHHAIAQLGPKRRTSASAEDVLQSTQARLSLVSPGHFHSEDTFDAAQVIRSNLEQVGFCFEESHEIVDEHEFLVFVRPADGSCGS